MNILIFDDDLKVKSMVPLMEENLRSKVNYFNEPVKAIKGILSGGYEMVMLEVLTSSITGLEICELLAFDERLSNIAVILVSDLPLYSEKFQKSLVERKELKMVKGVLQKPFLPSDLIAKVMNIKNLPNYVK